MCGRGVGAAGGGEQCVQGAELLLVDQSVAIDPCGERLQLRRIQVLEHAGLVTRTRDAQRRPVHLDAAGLEALTAWIDRYRLIHEQQFRNLDALLATTSGADAATREADPEAGTAQKATES